MGCKKCNDKGIIKEDNGAVFMCKDCWRDKYIDELKEKLKESTCMKDTFEYNLQHCDNEISLNRTRMELDSINDRIVDLENLLKRMLG